jgi:hypothetical protein
MPTQSPTERELLIDVQLGNIQDARNKLGEIVVKINQIKKGYSELSSELKKNESITGEYTKRINLLNTDKSSLLKTIRELTIAQRQETLNLKAADDSIIGMRGSLAALKDEYIRLGKAAREGIGGTDLLAKISKLNAEVSKAEQSMGVFSRNVGNYKSGFNGLSNSINQVAREMPNFAQSATIGFMALSNNLPILADEIKRVRDANALLVASGKPTVSVFKQIATAVFSWQSALITAISLSVIYAKEIESFITGVETLTEAQKKSAKQQEENILSVNKNINAYKVFKGELSESEAAYSDLIDEMSSGLTDIQKASAEKIASINGFFNTLFTNIMGGFGAVRGETIRYIDEAKERARAAAEEQILINKFINEANGKALDIANDYRQKVRELRNEQIADELKREIAKLNEQRRVAKENVATEFTDTAIANDAKAEIDKAFNIQIELATKKHNDKLDKADKEANDKAKKAQEEHNKLMLELERQYRKMVIDVDFDGFAEEVEAETERYNNEIEDFKLAKEEKLKEHVKGSKEYVQIETAYNKIIKQAYKQHEENLTDIRTKEAKRRNDVRKKADEADAKFTDDAYKAELENTKSLHDQAVANAINTTTDKKKLGVELYNIEVQDYLDRIALAKKYNNNPDVQKANKGLAEFKLKNPAGTTEKAIKEDPDKIRKATIDAAINAARETVDAVSKIKQDAIDRDLKRELTAIQRNADGQDRILENRLKNGIISEGQYNDAKQKLNEETAAKELEANRKAFEEKKRLDTATAIANGALAITNILAQVIDPTFTQSLKMIAIAAAVASTATQVAVIQSQKFALGGKVNGKSHAEGGVMIEAEGGEGMINKNSMRSTQVMQAIGTPSQIASAINMSGGGISWETGATLNSPNRNMFNSRSENSTITYSQMAALLNNHANSINSKKVVILESEITKTQNKVKAYETSGRF